ncbi:hypothetical protein [Rickettsia felis]|uniref:hypothetical protein n=1 Tax=Rickettsia felis TaxID=42862 RepID=UPI000A955905|nr:hypothetical protein [Rickettsia felis]
MSYNQEGYEFKITQAFNCLKHEAESVLAPYMSCGMEANQEAMELEGIDDEVQNHEVLA